MARRRKTSGVEDLVNLVAWMPWWVGVVLAVVGYWVLRAIATDPLPAVQSPAQLGPLLKSSLWRGFASVGQYLVPVVCIVGAVVSAVRHHQRSALFEAASAGSTADALQGMSWQQFELLVGEGFRRRGYSVKEMGGGGPDGGVDLVLTKGGEKSFVQCKQWKAFKVGVSAVRELYGLMAAHGAASGFVVTSGRFTRDAAAFANGRNIRLLDGPALMKLLREARSKDGVQPKHFSASALHTTALRAGPANTEVTTLAVEPTLFADPACPRCGKSMVRRVAKRGAAAGNPFWGCSAFSEGCRGTREI